MRLSYQFRISRCSNASAIAKRESVALRTRLRKVCFKGRQICNLSYGWDNNNNKISETIGGTMSGYGFSIPGSGYDSEDRLVAYSRTDGQLGQSWNDGTNAVVYVQSGQQTIADTRREPRPPRRPTAMSTPAPLTSRY